MKLKVIGSNSSGNCYILDNGTEALIIEAGCKLHDVQVALEFDLKRVVGAIITHEHGDHSKYVANLLSYGIDVYASPGTLAALDIEKSHRSKPIKRFCHYNIGGFSIQPFDVLHDAAEPFGYIIRHKDIGKLLFLTDTVYTQYKFPELTQIVVEANYCEEIIDRKLKEDRKFLRDRIIQSHMSIQTCVELLKANDLSKVMNIVLIHLSENNSHEEQFIKRATQATGKLVKVASKKTEFDLSLLPY